MRARNGMRFPAVGATSPAVMGGGILSLPSGGGALGWATSAEPAKRRLLRWPARVMAPLTAVQERLHRRRCQAVAGSNRVRTIVAPQPWQRLRLYEGIGGAGNARHSE